MYTFDYEVCIHWLKMVRIVLVTWLLYLCAPRIFSNSQVDLGISEMFALTSSLMLDGQVLDAKTSEFVNPVASLFCPTLDCHMKMRINEFYMHFYFVFKGTCGGWLERKDHSRAASIHLHRKLQSFLACWRRYFISKLLNSRLPLMIMRVASHMITAEFLSV